MEGKKRRRSNADVDSNKVLVKKLRTVVSHNSSDGESDTSLPDVSHSPTLSRLEQNVSPEPPVQSQKQSDLDIVDGLKLLIPPKEPAVRNGRRRATLLVCPASLIGHWVEQLQQHLHNRVNIKLKVHHGQNKALTGADLESYDIVITTYGTLAAEWGGAD